jgi:hypothetical protein
MPLDLTPLDEAVLPVAVRKVVAAGAPPQLKLMVARGLAPLAPTDLAMALYQLQLGGDEAIQAAARKTAGELPDPVLAVALAAPLDGRVLDWFARAVLARPRLVDIVLANAATDDRTFASLAQLGGEQLVEQVARNEMRLLRHPAIITALYLNRRTRMSTATRALELAIRAGVPVEGIPSYEEVRSAILDDRVGSAVVDAEFAAALAADPLAAAPAQEAAAEPLPTDGAGDTEAAAAPTEEDAEDDAGEDAREEPAEERVVNISGLPLMAKLRLAAIGGAFARAQLVRDSNKVIALAAVRSPALTEQEAERYSANRALHEEVIRHLASQRAFTKRYSVKLHLVNNPKCPLSLAIGFLPHLQVRDLQKLSRSKSVPSALTKAAQNLLSRRVSR